MNGKVCVVTGANSGIGKSLATSLAKRGAEVVMVCRSKERGEAALADVKREGGSTKVSLMLCDVGDMSSVRRFCDEWKSTRGHIDVLCNNAGLYLSSRATSVDGYEATFAINHLGPFLMTNLLLDRLDGARVITTSSIGHRFGTMNLATVENPPRYFNAVVYGNSKLCNILFTRELAKRHGDRVQASCFHPGPVGTGFGQHDFGLMKIGMMLGGWMLLTPDQGADTGLWLATEPRIAHPNGLYYARRKPSRTSAQGRDDALAAALWEKSARLTGLA